MKYIKTYEIKKPTYKAGDYISAHSLYFIPDEIKNFLRNNVGKLVRMETKPGGQIKKTPTKFYYTKYNNIPDNLRPHFDTLGCYALKSDQVSLATQEEIENQKIKDDSTKYNI